MMHHNKTGESFITNLKIPLSASAYVDCYVAGEGSLILPDSPKPSAPLLSLHWFTPLTFPLVSLATDAESPSISLALFWPHATASMIPSKQIRGGLTSASDQPLGSSQ
eukprot:765092-Hanusia_phi.AAC.3